MLYASYMHASPPMRSMDSLLARYPALAKGSSAAKMKTLLVEAPFGERIRFFREMKGLTLAELAHLLGVSRQRVHQIENFDVPTTETLAQRLSTALGISKRLLCAHLQCNSHARQRFGDQHAHGDFLRQLKLRRTSMGLTIKELAAKAGISVTSLCMIECGVTIPNRRTLSHLVSAIGRPLASFMETDRESPKEKAG